jgi:hypothetical protein
MSSSLAESAAVHLQLHAGQCRLDYHIHESVPQVGYVDNMPVYSRIFGHHAQ